MAERIVGQEIASFWLFDNGGNVVNITREHCKERKRAFLILLYSVKLLKCDAHLLKINATSKLWI